MVFTPTMGLWYVVIFFAVYGQALGYETVVSNFSANVNNVPDLFVSEGMTVTLLCPKRDRSRPPLYITVSDYQTRGEDQTVLIDSSNLINISSKYSFHVRNDNTYVFTLNRISRYDEGVYTCVQGPFTRARPIKVVYGPSGRSPRCSSNYNSPVIFYDEIKDDFVFYCYTERGKPPVITKVYFNGQEVTPDLEMIDESRRDKESTFSTYSLQKHFNDTLQNSFFMCNATQELPSPYDDYQGSCYFGPLHLLPGFSLSVSPSIVYINDQSKTTLTCTSNVTELEITWSHIPSEKYNVTNHNGSSVLTILSFKPTSNGTLLVKCIGSYGSRTITTNTTLVLMITAEEGENENKEDRSNTYIVVFVVIIVFCILAIPLSIIVFNCWKGKRGSEKATNASPVYAVANPSMSNHHIQDTLPTAEETNMNSNNTSVCLGMCKNVIYEPASFEHMAAECCKDEKMSSGKNRDPLHEIGNYDLGDDHLICENVIYQSLSCANKEGRNTRPTYLA